jgi:hypothetical protein
MFIMAKNKSSLVPYISLGIIFLIIGFTPVIFVGSNQTKLIWNCGRIPICDADGNDSIYVPSNPLKLSCIQQRS